MTRVSVCSGLLIPLPVHGKVCSREERQGGCSPFPCPQAGMNSSALGQVGCPVIYSLFGPMRAVCPAVIMART
jgi:hypothetical protein